MTHALPAPDLSPVAPPASLVVGAKLARPSASLGTLRAWSNLPMPQSDQLTELLLGEAVGPLVDLDQPMDIAATLGARGGRAIVGLDMAGSGFAVSVAVKDADAAKVALSDRYKLVPGDNGVLLLQGLVTRAHSGSEGEDDEDASELHRACELTPAFGSAATRLICAFGSDKALAELGPWLSRGAPRVANRGDLHVDFWLKPLQATLGEQSRMLGALAGTLFGGSSMPSLREFVSNAVQDLADFVLDMGSETIDISLSDSGARAELGLGFTGVTSTMARLALAGGGRGPTPPAFLQLPGDAAIAGFTRGYDEAILAHAREVFLKVVGEALGEVGVDVADRKALVEALGKLGKLIAPAASVYAGGFDPAVVKSAAGGGDASDALDAWSLAPALAGWHVLEIDRPIADVRGSFRDFVAGWSRPGVVEILRGKAKGDSPPTLRWAAMPKGPWPKDALQLVIDVAPPKALVLAAKTAAKKLAPPKPLLVHVLMVPDDARTWVAAAADEGVAATRLRAAMAGSGNTLGGRTDLASLRAASLGAGGFVTLRGFAAEGAALAALFGAPPKDVTEPLAEIAQLPSHGMAPLVFTGTPTSAGPMPSLVGSLEVPRQAIEDVLALVLAHGGL